MSVKRAFFGIFQKFMVVCCAVFFGFANAFSANLPAGYTELEYIGTSGTQYIDNIIKPNKNYSFEIKYKHTVSTGYQTLFAVYDGTTGYSYGFMEGSASNGNYAYSGNSKTFTLAYDTNTIYTLYYDGVNKKVYRNGTEIVDFSSTTGFSGTTGVAPRLFQMISGEHYSSSFNYPFQGYTYGFKVYNDNNVIVRDLVPAKRSSDGVIGMYDTVNNVFYQNAGTGTFTAGPVVLNPCRNLFDGEYISVSGGAKAENKNPFYVTPGKKYTISWSGSIPVALNLYAYGSNDALLHSWTSSSGTAPYFSDSHNAWYNGATFTVPENVVRLRFNTFGSISAAAQASWAASLQIEEGDTATAYVPYSASCHNTNAIKIATTAYNTAQFNPVVTDLNTTVATIRSVVTNTINQTAAIADLQAKKQTRPDEQCPAGKKCLLVETEENGVIVPHWFPIIEAPEDN